MQVNRLSTGLQEELKTVSNFNTARSDTLFQAQASTAANSGAVTPGSRNNDFGSYDTDNLGITSRQIEDLLDGFSNEVIKVFSSDILLDNPLRTPNPEGSQNGQEPSPSFTA